MLGRGYWTVAGVHEKHTSREGSSGMSPSGRIVHIYVQDNFVCLISYINILKWISSLVYVSPGGCNGSRPLVGLSRLATHMAAILNATDSGVPVLKQIFRGNSDPTAKWQAQSTRKAYTYHNLTRKSQRIPLIGEFCQLVLLNVYTCVQMFSFTNRADIFQG